MTSASCALGAADVLAHGLAVDGQRVGMDAFGFQQFVHHRRQAAGAVIFFAEIFSGRLHVDQQRHVIADFLPVLDRKLHADMARDGIDVDRRIGRAADGRIGDDGVLERLAGEDVGRFQVLLDDLDRAHAGLIGDLAALAVGRRNRGAAGQRHAERLRKRIHGRGGAHGVAVPDRGGRRRGDLQELVDSRCAGARAPRAPSRRPCRIPRARLSTSRSASARRRARSPECLPLPPPSGTPAWSCRSRSSARRRQADSRRAPRPG